MKMDEHLVDKLTVYRVLVLSEALSDFDAAVTGYSLLCHLHEVSHSFTAQGLGHRHSLDGPFQAVL